MIIESIKPEYQRYKSLQRSLAHASYHVGQIVLLARIHVGRDWKSLSIPRGKSQEYNSNPTKERP
jgi:hypothetical protein